MRALYTVFKPKRRTVLLKTGACFAGAEGHTLMWFRKRVCVVAEDSDGKRVPAAVGDGLADQRVVQDHPERHRQAGEARHTHTDTHMRHAHSFTFTAPLLYSWSNGFPVDRNNVIPSVYKVTVCPLTESLPHRLLYTILHVAYVLLICLHLFCCQTLASFICFG